MESIEGTILVMNPNNPDYENMKVAELMAICKGNAKYANYSRCLKKADLINHMTWCDERDNKAQQAFEQVAMPVPAPEVTAAPVAEASPAAGSATKLQTVPKREREAQYQNLTVGHLRHLCKTNGYNYADVFACCKAELIELLLEIPEVRAVEEPQTDYAPSIPMIKPALSKPVHVSSEEYLDDIAMPAPFWDCQITQSFTWGRWRFGEGESRQHGKYLSIACSELERHWIILWDWRSFEAAIKELIYGLSRLGEQAFIPSPGFLPAPPAEDEEPADGEDGDHGGGDPRRERNHEHNHLPNIDEVCVNCSGTQLCPGRNYDCGCKSENDCASLGWCVSCLPDGSVGASPWDVEHSSVGVPA